MAFQYPLPPPAPSQAADMEMPSSEYIPTYNMPPHGNTASMDMRTAQGSGLEEERVSDSNSALKRSMSTPNVTGQHPHPPDSVQLGLSDKKRNKLGYCRISIACGHCRKRKIRCIVAASDPQGRCVTCIRLKKPCVFEPVGEKGEKLSTESHSMAPSRASADPKAGSGLSSPALPPGQSPKTAPNQQQGSGTVSSTRSMASLSGGTAVGSDALAQEDKVPSVLPSQIPLNATSATRPFDFTNQPPMQNWMAQDASPAPTARSLDLNSPWRSFSGHDSPVDPSFSPYTANPPPSAGWNTPAPESASREDVPWPSYAAGHPRSISYGNDGHQSPQYPPMPQQARQFDRRPTVMSSDMYPHGAASVSTTSMDNSSLPLATTTTLPSNNYGSWQQQPYQYDRAGDGYSAGWAYDDHQDMQAALQTGSQVSATNEPHNPQPGGMYYSGR